MEAKSLVGYGLSSDSEEEGESSRTPAEEEKEAKGGGGGGEKKTWNFLLESASTSSSESEDEEELAEAVQPEVIDSSTEIHMLPSHFSSSCNKLPPPPLEQGGSRGLLVGSSVFANPFKERAEERLNVLQKHVPLTLQARPSQIGGRRICVAYRKDGRCRFGIRCKFAHDSDLQSSTGSSTEPAGSDNGAADQTELNPDTSHASDSSALEEEEEEESRKRKKHRVGLSDTLIPPKRALKQYAIQKDRISHH